MVHFHCADGGREEADGVSKTQKVLAMLQAFETHKTLTTRQMAAILDVDRRTVFRYMRELRAAGYTFRTKGGQRGITEYLEKSHAAGAGDGAAERPQRE